MEDSRLRELVHGHLKLIKLHFSKYLKRMKRVYQEYQIFHLEDVCNTQQREII
jgi:hypothetical protein